MAIPIYTYSHNEQRLSQPARGKHEKTVLLLHIKIDIHHVIRSSSLFWVVTHLRLFTDILTVEY
jgi:hypothetical protein